MIASGMCFIQAREMMQAEMSSLPEPMAANDFNELCDTLEQQLIFVPTSSGSGRFARAGLLSKKERCEALEYQLEVLRYTVFTLFCVLNCTLFLYCDSRILNLLASSYVAAQRAYNDGLEESCEAREKIACPTRRLPGLIGYLSGYYYIIL